MAIPNKGSGGVVHSERTKATAFNSDKTSRATFANEPNEEDWPYEGTYIKNKDGESELARQCAAADDHVRQCMDCGAEFRLYSNEDPCPDCGSHFLAPVRCQRIAVPGYMTCSGHGGGFKLSPKHRAALMSKSIKTGANFTEILYCPCNMFGDSCEYKNMYFDEDACARCYLEKMLFDSVVDHFTSTYDLDEVADMIVLQRLAMTILRIMRNERWVAQRGEVVERIRTSPDGLVEQWFEPNAATTIISKLDSQLLSWLKSLNVTKQNRDAGKNGSIGDIAQLLSDFSISKTQVIDLDTGDSSEST